jgi:hypothetical protein
VLHADTNAASAIKANTFFMTEASLGQTKIIFLPIKTNVAGQ